MGERLAADHLRRAGYAILDTNWRVRRYEIDLVAARDGIVAFVEVKTRRRGPEPPTHALAPAQMARLRRAGEAWIHSHPGVGREFRFDLIAVEVGGSGKARIEHIEDAFYGEHAP